LREKEAMMPRSLSFEDERVDIRIGDLAEGEHLIALPKEGFQLALTVKDGQLHSMTARNPAGDEIDAVLLQMHRRKGGVVQAEEADGGAPRRYWVCIMEPDTGVYWCYCCVVLV
jgi:L-asparaginase II